MTDAIAEDRAADSAEMDNSEISLDDFDDEFAEEDRAEKNRLRIQARHKGNRPDAGSDTKITQMLSQSDGLGELMTTYQPSRHERGWLLSSLKEFYEQGLISDIQASVKGGKEASVYRCRTAPDAVESVGAELLAAKVYRPRQLRNLRNDAQYRQGRPVLTAEGKAVKNSDSRIMRALGKKTGFGAQVQHTSWLMYEFTTLDSLYKAGASVPKPVAASENAILMGYCGNTDSAAPSLIEISLGQDEARHLFSEVCRNLRVMLSLDIVHGDLSAYNILYWEGKITLIDFPQVVNLRTNDEAENIFRRDVRRVCEYFTRMGVSYDPDRLADDLWRETGA